TLNPRPSTFNSQPSTLDSRLPTLDSPTIVDVGHARALDLAIEVPPSELGAVCMHEQWAEVNERLVELIRAHRSTLIFVNTRRLAERVTHQLTELLGEEVVGAHHGSLAADIRLDTEQRLKEGKLKAVVATASLELGLDIGYIDLVVQLGSPRAIATFLQRIGRSGHSLGLVPKGRLFALTRDELLECMALIRAVRAGRLDAVRIPEAPLDVLAQQIVAEAVGRESDPSPGAAAPGIDTDELFDLFRRAWPYRDLARQDFDRTIEYLSEGIAKQAGRGRTLLHHDQVNRRIRARRGARITATSNGGAIPEVASYRVVAEPEHTVVGTLDEDFAVESNAGDIFLLGNTSWRIHYVRGNDVTVSDAQGAPPTIPFWRGEAPGRTLELSEEVARLRDELENRLDDTTAAARWLDEETSCGSWAAQQAVEYCAAQQGAVGLLPTQKRVVFERFFDETGGMQLVVHAPFGGAINRAWGLAMRKRFCRSFDFELQATADDDGFILSLGPQHSFPIESLFGMLTAENARGLLEQAVLTVPMFQVRWRWNVTRALLVERMRSGKKVPPALQRFRADDLLTAVFPKLTGCQEEHTGDHEIPDHPLARQTMEDCLTEALDLPGLLEVLSRIERGEIQLIARDTREPSPFSYELLNAAPYAFLDGGEAQERRTRAVAMRRSLTVESVHDLGRLDPAAIEQVVREAQPLVRDADELHDALLGRIVLPEEEIADVGSVRRTEPKLASAASVVPPGSARQPATGTSPPPGEASLEMAASMVASGPAGPAGPTFELAADRRAGRFVLPDGRTAWVAAERLPAVEALFSGVTTEPPLVVPEGVEREWESTAARVAVVRGLLEVCGPITAADVAARLCITASQSDAALEALEGEGVVLRGRFSNAECGVRNAESEDDALSSAEWGVGNAESKNDSLRIPHSELRTRIEWCHRRLLARIHRLTLEGLRKQIEPVSRETFLRFLFRHHGVTAGERRSGGNGLFEVVQILQGLDLPAIAWERDVLPARLQDYQPAWLDELCLTGEIGWGRLYPSKRDPDRAKPMASLTRVVPVSLWLRQDLEWLADAQVPSPPLGERVRVRRNGPDDSTARERSSTNDMRRVGMDAVRTDDAREGPLTSPLSPAKPGERGLERPPLDHSDASRANPPSDPATSGGRIANPSASVGQAFEPAENCAAESRRGADKDVCPTDGGRIGNPSYDARTDDDLSGAAQDVFAILQKNGAMFAADLAREARLLPSQLEEALGELIARGHVTADGFAGLRNLIAEKPASRRESLRAGPWRQRRTSAGAGRWSLWRTISGQWTVDSGQNTGTVHRPPSTDHCSHWAWQLLRRWGVVFRDLLVREPGAPRWFELLQVYRRLEARGEIRGGRFVAGVGGEQFALGDSVRALRQLRDEGPQGELVAFSAADPLNLTGILGDDRRVPALATNRVAFLDGTLVAALIAGETQWLADLDETLRRKISKRFGRPVGRIADPSPVVGQAFQPAADSFVESERRADMDVCPTEAGRIANPSCANDDAPPDAAAKDEPPGEDSPPPDRPPRRKRYPNGIPRPMIS
ncbi:MAG: helicase-related protein, partial [Planctomycetales bacterium]